ncbi:hypothetical protein [Pseudomonas sp. GM67]|uniref:hypothetical protein n=1 Tax=Pseudomonas sp. GM67 TaxID=1144335 RepID=UPI000270C396|nr:hypothetical protein [Pseudomonas sp. GM67]EJM92484.1 hypothetical protein PMI33_00742 [Pseudomonas sp. GM67]
MPRGEKKKLFDQPPRVINRWFAIKAIRISRPYIESSLRFYLRIKLTLRERERSLALTSTLNTTIKEFRKLNQSNLEPLKIFFNLSLFFLLAEKDIHAVKIDAITHSDEWKRNLSLRVMLLVIHEWDMSKVAPANKLNEAYEAAGISEELREEMRVAFRKINKAHVKAKHLLAHIRHTTIAHRDADALLQYDVIKKLDTTSVINVAASFYEGADLFTQALPKLILEAGSTRSLLKQHSIFSKELPKSDFTNDADTTSI